MDVYIIYGYMLCNCCDDKKQPFLTTMTQNVQHTLVDKTLYIDRFMKNTGNHQS